MKPYLLLSLVLSTLLYALAAHDLTDPSTLVIALENPNNTILFTPPTRTSPNQNLITVAAANDPSNANADAEPPTKILTQTAFIKQTHLPWSPDPILIFPLHLSLTQHCPPSSDTSALFLNGDFKTSILNLSSDTSATIEHRIPGYPVSGFKIGPFYADRRGQEGEVRFSWENGEGGWRCEWGDGETWRVCGECRAGLWNFERLEKEDGEVEDDVGGGDDDGRECKGRVKEMDCSFVLGWKKQFRGVAVESRGED